MPQYKNLVIQATRCLRFVHLCPMSFQSAYLKVYFGISETDVHAHTFVIEPTLLHFHVVKSVCDFSLYQNNDRFRWHFRMSFAKEFDVLPHFSVWCINCHPQDTSDFHYYYLFPQMTSIKTA
jgi:hypothetical protein